MPRISFKHNGDLHSMNASPGTRLLDVCDELDVPVAFSCRSGTCGTCLVTVSAGANQLEPAGEHELDTLAALGANGSQRLACKAVLTGGSPDGDVLIELVPVRTG